MDKRAGKHPPSSMQPEQTLKNISLPRPCSMTQNAFINGPLGQKAILPRCFSFRTHMLGLLPRPSVHLQCLAQSLLLGPWESVPNRGKAKGVCG